MDAKADLSVRIKRTIQNEKKKGPTVGKSGKGLPPRRRTDTVMAIEKSKTSRMLRSTQKDLMPCRVFWGENVLGKETKVIERAKRKSGWGNLQATSS